MRPMTRRAGMLFTVLGFVSAALLLIGTGAYGILRFTPFGVVRIGAAGPPPSHEPAPAGRAAPTSEPTVAPRAEPQPPAAADEPVAAFEPVDRLKGTDELRLERLIESAYREYFKEYTIRGRRLTVRVPFALNDEREGGRGYTQAFHLDGKGTPAELWPFIDGVLASRKFTRYAEQIESRGEKVIVFDLVRRSYTVSRDPPLLKTMKRGDYPGTPTRIHVLRDGGRLTEADIYNYLYAVASVGVDCSGFAYHIQEEIARAYGMEMDRVLGESLGVDPRLARSWVGVWFYDPANRYTETVGDRIEDLRPADMILFRGSDGKFKHSAIIQSIDFQAGIIRYVQSTDWAVQKDRGVHISEIRFDPSQARVGLHHYTVRWLQEVRPPFEGEQEPRDWLNDGDRYFWYSEGGGSLVARPRFLANVLLGADPLFYANIYPDEPPLPGGAPPVDDPPTASSKATAP